MIPAMAMGLTVIWTVHEHTGSISLFFFSRNILLCTAHWTALTYNGDPKQTRQDGTT